jgi:hypothetical protein
MLFVKNKFPGQVLNNKYDIYKIKNFLVVVALYLCCFPHCVSQTFYKKATQC